jgi:hypothetical protein
MSKKERFNQQHVMQIKIGYMNTIMHVCANDDNHETENISAEDSYAQIRSLVYACRVEITEYKERVKKVGREW